MKCSSVNLETGNWNYRSKFKLEHKLSYISDLVNYLSLSIHRVSPISAVLIRSESFAAKLIEGQILSHIYSPTAKHITEVVFRNNVLDYTKFIRN